jgi:hypothetical protein
MVTATGRLRKSLPCCWGRRARMLTLILVTILSRERYGRKYDLKGEQIPGRGIKLVLGWTMAVSP